MQFNNEISRSHSGNVYTHKATEFNMEARESYQRMYHPSERLHMYLIISYFFREVLLYETINDHLTADKHGVF